MGVYLRYDKLYWISYTDKYGRRYRESTGLKDKAKALEFYYKRKTEIAEDKFLDKKKDQKIKFEDFADLYLEQYSKVENKSWKKSDHVLIKALKAFFTGFLLSDITKEVVAKFKAKRITQDVSGSTVNRNLACLKSIFNKAIEWGKFDGSNPVAKVKMFKEPEGRTRYLETAEAAKLIKCCEDRFKPYVIVAINTGLRQNEMLSLRWGDLDFVNGMIYALKTKNQKMREIPMNEAVKNAFISIKKQSDSPYVFCDKNKKSNVNIRCAFERALVKAKIEDFRWHDLRHTTASLLVMSGVDLNTVREILGHTTMKMTQRYAHLSQSFKKKAMSVLDGINRHQEPSTQNSYNIGK